MALDISKLTNVVNLADGGIQARCPACAAAGGDAKGEHLKVFADGRYACAANQGDSEHSKEIYKLAGEHGKAVARTGRVSVDKFEVPDSTVLMDLSSYPRFSRKPKKAESGTAEA